MASANVCLVKRSSTARSGPFSAVEKKKKQTNKYKKREREREKLIVLVKYFPE